MDKLDQVMLYTGYFWWAIVILGVIVALVFMVFGDSDPNKLN